MKKILASAVCLVLLSTASYAEGEKSDQKTPMINDLIKIQIPNVYVKSGQLKLTPEQKAKTEEVVRPLMHDEYQVKMNDAYGMEKRVQRMVIQGKSNEEMAPLLDEIAKLKREAIDVKLQVIEQFRTILTKEQWDTFLKLSQNK